MNDEICGIGKGIPKICVPVVASGKAEIMESIEKIVAANPDMIELRADYIIDNVKTLTAAKEIIYDVLKAVKEKIGRRLLLFTIRTKKEGGEADIKTDEYIDLCRYACESGLIDLIDVEAFIGEGVLGTIKEIAHANDVYVVGSNHDFEKTPDEDEMVRRLLYMGDNGADIVKLAVMPASKADVLSLLSATDRYRNEKTAKPVITMSMGSDGLISRLSGEIFGSAVTFAAVGKVSAPGQIPVDEVKTILNVLHKYQSCGRNS